MPIVDLPDDAWRAVIGRIASSDPLIAEISRQLQAQMPAAPPPEPPKRKDGNAHAG